MTLFRFTVFFIFHYFKPFFSHAAQNALHVILGACFVHPVHVTHSIYIFVTYQCNVQFIHLTKYLHRQLYFNGS